MVAAVADLLPHSPKKINEKGTPTNITSRFLGFLHFHPCAHVDIIIIVILFNQGKQVEMDVE